MRVRTREAQQSPVRAGEGELGGASAGEPFGQGAAELRLEPSPLDRLGDHLELTLALKGMIGPAA
ncbi:hypothetical protein ACFRAO_08680 [Streptomyces sp. NPDC056656]|uniref:hypothetical protein n=1 Tax=Streptomyces sp. NPDC056656 TaxID=3345895 RepID=UPI0036749443